MSKVEEATVPMEAMFAIAMQKLRENEHKGHWRFEGLMPLWNRLAQEVAELHQAIRDGESPEAIARECGDIWNIAMMVADNAGGLK